MHAETSLRSSVLPIVTPTPLSCFVTRDYDNALKLLLLVPSVATDGNLPFFFSSSEAAFKKLSCQTFTIACSFC